MKRHHLLSLLFALLLSVITARADGTSYVGSLASSTDVVYISLTLSSASDVILQTYGFGGGTNQAGTTISPGGTDPFLAMFAGAGAGATILTDAFSNPFGTSLDITNYGSFIGCPPANTELIVGLAQCGDVTMNLKSLPPGAYTIVLSDGQYIANAIFDNGALGEGFSDFTGGVFCNLDINGVPCPNTSGAYALDVITTPLTVTSPEPATLLLLGIGFVGMLAPRRHS